MVDSRAVVAADAVVAQGAHDGGGDLCQFGDVVGGNAQAVVIDEEEPVAAPGDVAVDAAEAGNVERDLLAVAVGAHVFDADAAVCVQGAADVAHRRFHGMHARRDATEVVQ